MDASLSYLPSLSNIKDMREMMTERRKYLDAKGEPIKHNQRYKINGIKGVIQWDRRFRAYIFRTPVGMQHLVFKNKGNISTIDAERIE
jgi:hypothetical protein